MIGVIQWIEGGKTVDLEGEDSVRVVTYTIAVDRSIAVAIAIATSIAIAIAIAASIAVDNSITITASIAIATSIRRRPTATFIPGSSAPTSSLLGRSPSLFFGTWTL